LILGVHIPGLNAQPSRTARDLDVFPNAFLRIAKDGSVTVIGNHSEMGQGAYMSGAMTIAEELDADWTKIRVEPAPVIRPTITPFMESRSPVGSTVPGVSGIGCAKPALPRAKCCSPPPRRCERRSFNMPYRKTASHPY